MRLNWFCFGPALLTAATLQVSCTRFKLNTAEMTPGEIVQRSTHLFIGVIEKHESPSSLLFRPGAEDPPGWRVIRMRVRVELVVRGQEPNPTVDLYQVFPTGGVSGNWNSTQDGVRYLFPVRKENGNYRVTRDFWRSIYPVYSGRHNRLPLDESRPFWERFALMQWWIQPNPGQDLGSAHYADPGGVLGDWRLAKILRGLLRHPDKLVRMGACEHLMHLQMAQDECWDSLAPQDREGLNRFWNAVTVESVWNGNRRFEESAHREWNYAMRKEGYSEAGSINTLRLFTTMRNRKLREEFCGLFLTHFPNDREHGCPASSQPPATIVTEDGDVPLIGPWPGGNVARGLV